MKTRAIARIEVRRYLQCIEEPFIWVSVREPDNDDPHEFYKDIEIPSFCKGVLVLVFSDLICEDWSAEAIEEFKNKYPKQFVPFTTTMKSQIDEFIQKYKDVNLCITNCHAGVSRSAALSAYIGRTTGEEDWFPRYYETRGKFPCHYVCRILDLPIPSRLK